MRSGMKIYPLDLGKLWIQYAAAEHFKEEEMRMGRPTGVTVIAILDFLGAAFCVVIGLAMMLGGGFLASFVNQQGGQGNAGAAGILAGLGAALGIFCLIIAAIDIVLAVGLLKLKEWARIVTIILTGIFGALVLLGLLGSFIHFNLFATVIRICVLAIQTFIIMYLLKPEVKAAFQAPQVRAASA
jgi:hypothetical protein